MPSKRTIFYLKSISLALGITVLLHFFVLLLLIGYNVLKSPVILPFDLTGMKTGSFIYSFCSLFFFLFIEFVVVFKIQGYSRRYKAGWIALAVLSIALVYGLIVMRIYHEIYELSNELSFRFYVSSLIGNGFLSLMVMIMSYTDFLTSKQQVIALENQKLRAQNLQSRYEALKNQIDPHFLFNTFSSLTSMIELDPARAQEFSIRMSSVLRYTLQTQDVVTLEEEIGFTRDYCSLMQIRYGENLRFETNLDPSFDKYYVVPLSVQTLIENAVKHNEISNRCPLTISVHTNPDATLTVSNPINIKRDGSFGTGLGLANLSERYMLKFQREVKIFSNEKVFMVTIPLIIKGKNR